MLSSTARWVCFGHRILHFIMKFKIVFTTFIAIIILVGSWYQYKIFNRRQGHKTENIPHWSTSGGPWADHRDILRKVATPSGRQRKLSRRVLLTPQADALLEDWPQGKGGGTFVEVGAHDVETSSNSLALEVYYNWTGLLIEADSDYYMQLTAKHRQAHSLHGCISPGRVAKQMYFREENGQTGYLIGSREDVTAPNTYQMSCVPLGDILLALNMTHVNYLSLDIEGLEYAILANFPFNRVAIDYISVEYLHVKQGKTALQWLMDQKGYALVEDLQSIDIRRDTYVHDFLFVHLAKRNKAHAGMKS